MKKVIVMAACLGAMLFASAGIAGALTITDTQTFKDLNLTGSGSFAWSHTTPEGFDLYEDILTKAELKIVATWDQAPEGKNFVFINNVLQGIPEEGEGITMNEWADVFVKWDSEDLMAVTFNYDQGERKLKILSSVFTLDYLEGNPSNVPVPEPATLLLLGSGLSGLAFWGKRKKAA